MTFPPPLPGQYGTPPGPYGAPPPPPFGPPGRRRRPVLLMVVPIVVVVALTVGGVVIGFIGTRDPGGDVPQPHRRTANGTPHWVGLSEDWDTDGGYGEDLDKAGLASDGTRFVTVHQPFKIDSSSASRVTGYDGATGKRLWNKGMSWTPESGPVAGGGVVIIPTGGIGAPAVYVALDTATGKERWRVTARDAPERVSAEVGRPQPAGVLRGGVFYYADGGTIIGVDAATGKPRYRLTSRKYRMTAGPVAAAGRIAALATASDGTQAVLSLPPDLARYRPARLAGSSADRIAASGDVVAAWSKGGFSSADVRTGRPLASGTPLPANHLVEGVIGRTVVVGGTYAYSGEAFGYDLITGRRTWSAPRPDDSSATDGFDVQDGTLLGLGNQISILDPTTGKTVFDRTAHGAGSGRRHSAPTGVGGLAAPAAGHLVVYNRLGITGYR